MTTIAYDSKTGEIAADSQETGGNGEKYNCQKLYRIGDAIVATAGGTYAGMKLIEFMDEYDGEPEWGEAPDLTNLDLDEDFECLVIRGDGTCYMINRLFAPADQSGNRFITLGSGGKAARGAMMAGASPKEAVEIAKKIDTYTGGKVHVMVYEEAE